jgi:ESCRT-I complex subunit TSG101
MVNETTLNWLYSVLTSVRMSRHAPIHPLTTLQNYTELNRTYHDATEALSHYPSLSVRTDVYST